MREICGISRDGSNAVSIARVAESYGLISRAKNYGPKTITYTACVLY